MLMAPDSSTHDTPPETPLECDSLYLSPHRDDIALACAGRLVREAAAGQRVLVVTLFGPGIDDPALPAAAPLAALRELGADFLDLGLPEAGQRHARYLAHDGLLGERQREDEECLHRAVDALTNIAHRTPARQVYAPMAVGGHIDHRLAHEAARAAFPADDGRNVFLYEERPEALVPGAVRVRLGQLGARLPPAAVEAPGRSGLGSYLRRFHLAPVFRGELAGGWDRLRSLRTAWTQWRSGRSWSPLRALGPRLQPVTYATGQEDLARVRELQGGWSGAMARLASEYARALAGAAHAERYWLLLPPREADGLETLEEAGEAARSTLNYSA